MAAEAARGMGRQREAPPADGSGERGTTLVVTLLLMVVLSLIAASSLQRGGLEVEAAGSRRRYASAVSCVDAARELVISQFIIAGTRLENFALEPREAGGLTLSTGHYDTDHRGQVALDVIGNCGNIQRGGASQTGEDQGSQVAGSGATGGFAYTNTGWPLGAMMGRGGGGTGSASASCGVRVPVVCRDEAGRAQELEFVVRIGL